VGLPKTPFESVCTSTVVVSLEPFSPTPSTLQPVKTPDPQSPGPAFLVESEQTPEKTEGHPDTNEPAVEGDTKMQYYSDQFHSTIIGAVTKNFLS
jgi:hypothetical protein